MTTIPVRATSVIAQQPWFAQATPERRRAFVKAVAESKKQHEQWQREQPQRETPADQQTENLGDDRRHPVAEALTNARQRATRNKERVQAHPDLARRLCRSLGYTKLDQWNGYVPPGRVPGIKDDDWLPNNSPVRVELVAILREAIKRDSAG